MVDLLVHNIEMLIPMITSIIERGSLFTLVVLGLFITSRTIRLDDVTVEGSFGFAGALTTWALLQGYGFVFSTLIGALAGSFAGFLTGLIYVKLRVNHVIAGLIVTTGLFSLQLKLGGAHQVVMSLHDRFSDIGIFVLLIMVAICMYVCIQFMLATEIGLLMFAVGRNPLFVGSLGKSISGYIIGGFALANFLTGLSGALFVQYVGFFSVWNSVGILIIGLASLILSELIDSKYRLRYLCGGIMYQTIIMLTYEFPIDPDMYKLITALLLLGLFTYKHFTHESSI